jgi:hypothetical protein
LFHKFIILLQIVYLNFKCRMIRMNYLTKVIRNPIVQVMMSRTASTKEGGLTRSTINSLRDWRYSERIGAKCTNTLEPGQVHRLGPMPRNTSINWHKMEPQKPKWNCKWWRRSSPAKLRGTHLMNQLWTIHAQPLLRFKNQYKTHKA